LTEILSHGIIISEFRPYFMAVHQFGNLKLSYEIAGEGELALLFLHGLGGSRRQWIFQKEYFRNRYLVVLPDLFEHGESQKGLEPAAVPRLNAEALDDLMRNIVRRRYIAIGHSLAGLTLGEMLRIEAENLTGAVFVDCTYQGSEEVLSARETFAHSMLSLADEPLKIEALKWYSDLIGSSSEEFREIILADFRQCDYRHLFEVVASCREFNRRFPPAQIPLPPQGRVLIMEADGGVGADFRRSWVNHFKDAEYFLFEDARHFFFVIEHQKFNKILEDFLSRFSRQEREK